MAISTALPLEAALSQF